MERFVRYYGQWQGVRSQLVGLPSWARGMVFIAAIPGILLLVLSIVGVLVSLSALFLLTVPIYGLLRAVTARPSELPAVGEVVGSPESGRRHVDVKIIE